jgi:hypothetical protein
LPQWQLEQGFDSLADLDHHIGLRGLGMSC